MKFWEIIKWAADVTPITAFIYDALTTVGDKADEKITGGGWVKQPDGSYKKETTWFQSLWRTIVTWIMIGLAAVAGYVLYRLFRNVKQLKFFKL